VHANVIVGENEVGKTTLCAHWLQLSAKNPVMITTMLALLTGLPIGF